MIIIAIIVVSAIINMFADKYLTTGWDHKNPDKSEIDVIRDTPDGDLVKSGILGAICISFWFSLVYYLMDIPGKLGIATLIAFVVMIATIIIFHVACSFSFLLVRKDEKNFDNYKKNLNMFAFLPVLPSLVFSGLMFYLGYKEIIHMEIVHYVLLPIFSAIIIQSALGNLLAKVPYFKPVSGTLAMGVSLVSVATIFI